MCINKRVPSIVPCGTPHGIVGSCGLNAIIGNELRSVC